MMEYGRIVIIPLYIGCALSFFLLILIGGGFFFDLEIWFMISVMSLWAIVYVLFAMILMVLFVRRIGMYFMMRCDAMLSSLIPIRRTSDDHDIPSPFS